MKDGFNTELVTGLARGTKADVWLTFQDTGTGRELFQLQQ